MLVLAKFAKDKPAVLGAAIVVLIVIVAILARCWRLIQPTSRPRICCCASSRPPGRIPSARTISVATSFRA